MRKVLAWQYVLVVLIAVACGDSGTGPDPEPDPDPDPEPPSPVVLPILGLGEVNERYTGDVAAYGDYAYTTTVGERGQNLGDALKIWNASGDVPVLVDSIIVPEMRVLTDVQVSGDGKLLMVAGGEEGTGAILLYDLSDPAAPRFLARHSSPNTDQHVHTAKFGVVDGTLYGFLSAIVQGNHVIVDLSDPTSPREVATLRVGQPYSRDVHVRDGLLLMAMMDEGLGIWDIGGGGQGGTPENPVLIGQVETVGGNAHNVWWYHDPNDGSQRYAFVGEEHLDGWLQPTSGDIHVVDISDPTAPVEVAYYTVPDAGTHNFWVDEQNGVLYAAYYNAGVRALDVTGDLGDCEEDARAEDGRCRLDLMGREVGEALSGQEPYIWGVFGSGTSLYASDVRRGLYKLDIAEMSR